MRKKLKYKKEVLDSKWEVIDILTEHYNGEGFQIYNGYLNYYNDVCPCCRCKIEVENDEVQIGLINPCPIETKNSVWVILYGLCKMCEEAVRKNSNNREWMKKYNIKLAIYFYENIQLEKEEKGD